MKKVITTDQKAIPTVPELKKFAEKHNIKFASKINKPELTKLILENVPPEEAKSFLFTPIEKKGKQKKEGSSKSKQQLDSGSVSKLEVRLTALEGQVRELIDQFKDLRNLVVKNIDNESQLSVEKVYQTARTLSNKNLTALDVLRNELNPSKNKKIDKQIQDFLKHLMEEGKIQLQEMKSEFQIQIRTDIFGGFKVLSI